MSKKTMRILGKRGNTTIPYAIRMAMGIHAHDVVSFEQMDDDAIILRKERICEGCTAECITESDNTLLEIIKDFTPKQQEQAYVYLNYLFAQRVGVKTNE